MFWNISSCEETVLTGESTRINSPFSEISQVCYMNNFMETV
jgi:hypothetical protein